MDSVKAQPLSPHPIFTDTEVSARQPLTAIYEAITRYDSRSNHHTPNIFRTCSRPRNEQSPVYTLNFELAKTSTAFQWSRCLSFVLKYFWIMAKTVCGDFSMETALFPDLSMNSYRLNAVESCWPSVNSLQNLNLIFELFLFVHNFVLFLLQARNSEIQTIGSPRKSKNL